MNSYVPDTWADNDPTKPLSAARMTNLAGQYAAAMADAAVAFAPSRLDGAPASSAPLMVSTPVSVTTGLTVSALAYNPTTGVYYGSSAANGHYMTSTDAVTWTDRTFSPSTYTPGLIGMQFDATNMYGYSSTGRIWVAPLDVFNGWTEISVAGRGPLTTGRPGSLLALGAGVLLYGNYTSAVDQGAFVWRSTNAGTSWTPVISIPTGKHIHCIRKSPNTGIIWCTIGDAGFTGRGLWKSADQGVTWTLMASNDYGIDMVFIPATGGRPPMVVMEGDGINRPHLMGFYETAAAGAKMFPLVWFTGAPTDPNSTRGTVRGMCLTPNGDIAYFTTTEAGAVGTKAGLYVAQGPDFTRAILLKDMTGIEPVSYLRSYPQGAAIYNAQTSFPLPTFGAY